MLIDSLPEDFAARSPLEKCQYLEMKTLLHGYLLNSQGDRMLIAPRRRGSLSLSRSSRHRVPGRRARKLSPCGLEDKAILRETFRRDLPDGICERPEFAFCAPELSVFIVKDPDGLVARHFDPDAIREAGIFDADAVQQFWRRLQRTPAERYATRDNLAFVQMLSTQILHHQHVRCFAPSVPSRGSTNDVTITYARSQRRHAAV